MGIRSPFLFLSALLLGGCFQQDNNRTSQILPRDYQNIFQPPVRTCRLVVGHDSKYIVVRVNSPEAQQAYLAANCLLPQGSVVVAEEYDKSNCTGLTGYTLMFKDVPGYDPNAADWHWQRLDDQRVVLDDGRLQACISCHQTCSLNDYTCSPP
jgi:hypothetical protein